MSEKKHDHQAEAPAAPAVVTKIVMLPSGKRATVREGKGRDLMMAQRVVVNAQDTTAVIYALVAQLTQIDGQPVMYEDLLEMPVGDVLMLMGEALGNNALPSALPSPASSSGDSRRGN